MNYPGQNPAAYGAQQGYGQQVKYTNTRVLELCLLKLFNMWLQIPVLFILLKVLSHHSWSYNKTLYSIF